MKYDEHIQLLREVKAYLPMTEEDVAGHAGGGDDKSEFICDNLSGDYGVRSHGDTVADEIKDLIRVEINGNYDLIEFLDFSGTFEEGQQERQKFLDKLIRHYENLNEQS